MSTKEELQQALDEALSALRRSQEQVAAQANKLANIRLEHEAQVWKLRRDADDARLAATRLEARAVTLEWVIRTMLETK